MLWIKRSALFVWGYAFGFGTLLALLLLFGDDGGQVQAEPAVSVGASPTAIASVTDAPTVASVAIIPPATLPPIATFAPSPTPNPTATPLPVPVATPLPVVMNQDLVLDGIRWRAVAVQELGNFIASGNDWVDDATTDGKFVQVTMHVENRRTEPESGYTAPDIVDAQGRRFRAYEERFYYLPDSESCSLETFNPNLTRTCTEIYTVAADSAGVYQIIVNDFAWIDPLEAHIELR